MSSYCYVCGSDNPNGMSCKDFQCPRVFQSFALNRRAMELAYCVLYRLRDLEYKVTKYRGHVCDMIVWCRENLNEGFSFDDPSHTFKFEDESDAVAFITTFAGGERDVVI